MDKGKHLLDRRTFVKATVGTAAAAAGLGSAAEQVHATAPVEQTSRIGGMATVTLPRGGFASPKFGFGGSAMGGYGLKDYKRPTAEEAIGMVRHAYDMGVRYFDTAPNYRTEPVYGQALKDVRDKVFFNTKTLARNRETARKLAEQSLRLLQTDVIDCLKLHWPGEYDYAMRVTEELVKLRAEGKVRNIGLSNHVHFEVTYKLISTGAFDEILIARGYFPRGMSELFSPRNLEFREMAVAKAHELDMNIIGMKSMCSRIFGHQAVQWVPDYEKDRLAELPGAALRWALSDPRFHLYVIGVALPSDVDDNVKIVSGDLELTGADRLLLADFTTRMWEVDWVKKLPMPYMHEGDVYSGVPPARAANKKAEG